MEVVASDVKKCRGCRAVRYMLPDVLARCPVGWCVTSSSERFEVAVGDDVAEEEANAQ